MALRRLRILSAPRLPSLPGVTDPPDEAASGAAEPYAAADDDLLAYWLAQTDQARADPTKQRLWSLLTSNTFADLWYEARNAGERFRAATVAALYAQQQQPGGRYPDPRLPAAFSERALVDAAARSLGLTIWQQPPCSPQGAHHDAREPLALLMTYQRKDNMAPKLIVHAEMPHAGVTQTRLLFEMTCMLGYITREQCRMLDPDAPHGTTLLPTSPGARTILHQFAFAFLYLEPRCPDEWTCHCNLLRAQYNAPPASHAQPTDTLALADLAAETERLRSDQQQK
jgi:hypothetical protein